MSSVKISGTPGFEPGTSRSAVKCSTTKLYPLEYGKKITEHNNITLFTYEQMCIVKIQGHPGLNQGPVDLQSNALPLSYIPMNMVTNNTT